ncbi:MAG: methylated-DNA--[protein]-cysteine S-methyltransferase [Spirochaetaceae bacterium]
MVKNKTLVYTHTYPSPIGDLFIAVRRNGAVARIGFVPLEDWGEDYVTERNKYACGEVEYQLEEYFAGRLRRFSVDLHINGTEFQRLVWQRLRKIDYGSLVTYGEIARRIGKRDAARAVGNAVASNPIPIIIPCHRVVPASGELGNYALRSLDGNGTETKRSLLKLEGAIPALLP